MKKSFLLLLKFSVSFLLLFFLFSRVGKDRLLQPLRQAELRYLAAALGLYLLFQVLCALRWRFLASPLGFQEGISRFVYYYYCGMFFNLFLPTSIGGDLSRCYYLARGEGAWRRALFSVLADRGIGFLSLALIIAAALPFPGGALLSEEIRFGTVGLMLLLLLGLIAPFYLKGFFTSLKFPMIYWERPSLIFLALLMSILLQMIVIGAHMLVGFSLALPIPWGYYFIFPPLAAAAGMLPVSVSGLGVREGAYVFLLAKAGIPWESGLAFALGWLFVLFSASLIGGVVWISKPILRVEEGSEG